MTAQNPQWAWESSLKDVLEYLVSSGEFERAQSLLPKLPVAHRLDASILLAGAAKQNGDEVLSDQLLQSRERSLQAETLSSIRFWATINYIEIQKKTGLESHLLSAVETANAIAAREEGFIRRGWLIALASTLANLGKSDLAVSQLQAAVRISDEFGRCKDLAQAAYVYAKLSRYSDGTGTVVGCSDRLNIVWKLYAYAMVLRARSLQTRVSLRDKYHPGEDADLLKYSFEFNARI